MATKRPTKRQRAALHAALDVNDVLYAEFRYLNEQLHREAQKLFAHRKRVVVLQRRTDKILEHLQVEDVQYGPNFTRIIVR